MALPQLITLKKVASYFPRGHVTYGYILDECSDGQAQCRPDGRQLRQNRQKREVDARLPRHADQQVDGRAQEDRVEGLWRVKGEGELA